MPSSKPDYQMGQYDPEWLGELRELVDEFDSLLNLSYTRPMTNEDTKELNGMFEALSHIEETHWEGVNPKLVALIQDKLDTDFPMIRHSLGMLPTPNTNVEGENK